MKSIRWNKDIGVDKVGEEAIDRFIESMPNLKQIQMEGPIHKKSKRDELRSKCQDRDIVLMLTPEDDPSDSESEVSQRDEDKESDSSEMFD